jgi:hypothetical protein
LSCSRQDPTPSIKPEEKPDDTPEADDITPEAEAIGSYTFDGTDFSLELLSTELEPYPQAVD